MTQDEHKARHEQLHQAFDELIADYLTHNAGKLPSTTTVYELMVWSHSQTLAPVDPPRVANIMHEVVQ